MWTEIAEHIVKVTKSVFCNQPSVCEWGCINQGYAVTGDTGTYFVKLNQASLVAMFEAEAQGHSKWKRLSEFPNLLLGHSSWVGLFSLGVA